MGKKLMQVTDNIHGTIYLSSLESELISTPYFYRLHDVYQSSTVYMTFPSNRTKRYEHSLGTMELAGNMLYSAISNADLPTKTSLFENLQMYFENILEAVVLDFGQQEAEVLLKSDESIGELFGEYDGKSLDELIKDLYNDISCAYQDGSFKDSALDYYQYYLTQLDDKLHSNGMVNMFLYRCLLQAVRIVALFHDVGHPPYSHIIEEVLKDLYDESQNPNKNWDADKAKTFERCTKGYFSKDGRKAYSCHTVLCGKISCKDNSHPHERIGISFIQSVFKDVIPDMIADIQISSQPNHCKRASILYYILVVKFATAMLVETDTFFTSFHRIVDGILDADCMDYITRDSLNSGIDWGVIPYKRLINSAKLFYMEKEDNDSQKEKGYYIIAYPKKLADDIEDILLTRYKIFARINYHHRCMKTSTALKTAVKLIALDYLESSSNEKCINADIVTLWQSLGDTAGDRTKRVILWNDSWLISMLHRSLVNINNSKNPCSIVKENLEEILLNKKKYYSLFKRGSDAQKIVRGAFEYAGITKEKLDILLCKEYTKYYDDSDKSITTENMLTSAKLNALDSIQRIKTLRSALKMGDLESLSQSVPFENIGINEIVETTLINLKNEGKLTDYRIIINTGRAKTGLPKHEDLLDYIYLYVDNETEKPEQYDEERSLLRQISVIEKNIVWLYVYFIPGQQTDNGRIIVSDIQDAIARAIGENLQLRFEELFGK